jgi:hypothetical protein
MLSAIMTDAFLSALQVYRHDVDVYHRHVFSRPARLTDQWYDQAVIYYEIANTSRMIMQALQPRPVQIKLLNFHK